MDEPPATADAHELPPAFDDWSPKDHPEAIALSQTQWWAWAVRLCADRMRNGHGPQQQIDARFFVISMAQLRTSAAIGLLSPSPYSEAAAEALQQAITRFDEQVPDIKHARDVLTHLDEYSHGNGVLQRAKNSSDEIKRVLAREFTSGMGYHPTDDVVRLGADGRYVFVVDTVLDAADALLDAVHRAGLAAQPR